MYIKKEVGNDEQDPESHTEEAFSDAVKQENIDDDQHGHKEEAESEEEEGAEVVAMDDAKLETPEFDVVDCTPLGAVSVVLEGVPVVPDEACDVEEC